MSSFRKIKQHLWNSNPKFFDSIASLVAVSNSDIRILYEAQARRRLVSKPAHSPALLRLRVGLIHLKLVFRYILGYGRKLIGSNEKLDILKLGTLDDQSLLSRVPFERRTMSGSLSAILGGKELALRPTIVTEGIDDLFLLRDVTLVGGSGLVFQGGLVFWGQSRFPENSSSLYPGDPILVAHDSEYVAVTLNPTLQTPTLRVSSGLSLLDSSGESFGHFVLGAISKLRVFRSIDYQKPRAVILDKHWPPQFKKFVSELLPKLDIIEVGRGDTLQVDELYFPQSLKHFPDVIKPSSPPGFEARAFSIPEFSFLFESSDLAYEHKGAKGVFLFRKGTNESYWREILNIEDVKRLLRAKGFQDISKEYADLEGLREKLCDATHIVTDDGSISFNLLLAGVRGKKILFFSGPDFGGHQEWGLPGYLPFFENDVIVVLGKCKPPEDRQKPWWIQLEDIQSVFESTAWLPKTN